MVADTLPTGEFYVLAFSPFPVADRFAAVYQELLEDHDPRDILFLKRIPCNLGPLAEHI
jgi:hypothetical protein